MDKNNLVTTEDIKETQETGKHSQEESLTDIKQPELNKEGETKANMRKLFEAKLKQQREELEAKYQEAKQKAQTTEERLQQFEKKLELKEKQLQVKEVLYSSDVDPEFYDFVSERLMNAENPEQELQNLIDSKPKLKKVTKEIRKPSFTTSSSNGGANSDTNTMGIVEFAKYRAQNIN